MTKKILSWCVIDVIIARFVGMVERMSFHFEVAFLIHQLAEVLVDRGSLECWFGIGVALEAKKFVAVKRNDEITAFIGLN